MNSLIFGVNGQDGYFLSELLLKRNIKVIGVLPFEDNWIKGDVADFSLYKI